MKKTPYNPDFEELKKDMMSHQNANYDEQHKTMRSVTYGGRMSNKRIKQPITQPIEL